MKYFITFLMSFFILFSCSAQEADDASGISGKLVGGLRILSVDNEMNDLDFTVYRGDYIAFKFLRKGFFVFNVPDLEIDTQFASPNKEKKYVKMKQTGEFAFTLGGRPGRIRVVELEEPNYALVSSDEAAELIENVQPLILDVRTRGEFNSGHIPGAKLIPVQVLDQKIDTIMEYKDQPVFIYCASGNRSTVAARMLIDAGFTNIYNLRYGISEWKRKGYPISK